MLEKLASVFARDQILVSSPDFDHDDEGVGHSLSLARYEGPRSQSDWVLRASDYLSSAGQMERHNVARAILLGPDAGSLPTSALREMADSLNSGTDLVVPSYSLGPHDGLVNSALLYPLTRALFASNVRFPLAADVAMSRRMAARLAVAAQRQINLSQPNALLWPVAEAAISAFAVRQVEAGAPSFRAPDASDFNALFTEVAASLFADIESKAAFWQRARTLAASRLSNVLPPDTTEDVDDEVRSMVEAFRLAHTNLQEIWSLILPPQSLLALKKLSVSEPANFSLSPALWARVVYDFVLAFHLRTLNRGHLLGALTPLYLAWVASTLRTVGDRVPPALQMGYIEETASAFEREKPYLVARWRWPDRFNP